jgi:uncharacterized protein YyaL (SSP411 family)
VAAAASRLLADFDEDAAGFGGAPKFPPSMVLEFLLRHHERTGDRSALTMSRRTCTAMARGGMYDQLGGGFARYAVDARWVVPHFEKMLYDNALLLRAYLHLWRLSDDPLALRVARQTADFMLRDLRTPEGGFASALDADTAGVEGLTYVWTPEQLRDVLGHDAEFAADVFSVTRDGTFEHGASTLQLLRDPDDQERLASVRVRLFEARTRRPQPARDDKVLASWNGLAIAALAEAGLLLDRRYLDAAIGCAELVTRVHWVDGRLRRTSRDGEAGASLGVADDYGNLAQGLLVLHQATGDVRWLGAAENLLDVASGHFAAPDGGFFDTADDAEQLVRRPREPADNATPSGTSAIAAALLSHSALTGSPDSRARCEAALASLGAMPPGQPRFFGEALAVAEGLLAGPVQVAVSGSEGDPARTELETAAWRARPPGAVVVAGPPDATGVALLQHRPLVDGQPAAYVCHGMVCDLPVTTVPDLLAALRS